MRSLCSIHCLSTPNQLAAQCHNLRHFGGCIHSSGGGARCAAHGLNLFRAESIEGCRNLRRIERRRDHTAPPLADECRHTGGRTDTDRQTGVDEIEQFVGQRDAVVIVRWLEQIDAHIKRCNSRHNLIGCDGVEKRDPPLARRGRHRRAGAECIPHRRRA